jgi:hypothetical protein
MKKQDKKELFKLACELDDFLGLTEGFTAKLRKLSAKLTDEKEQKKLDDAIYQIEKSACVLFQLSECK